MSLAWNSLRHTPIRLCLIACTCLSLPSPLSHPWSPPLLPLLWSTQVTLPMCYNPVLLLYQPHPFPMQVLTYLLPIPSLLIPRLLVLCHIRYSTYTTGTLNTSRALTTTNIHSKVFVMSWKFDTLKLLPYNKKNTKKEIYTLYILYIQSVLAHTIFAWSDAAATIYFITQLCAASIQEGLLFESSVY